jgi:hypothetical protein
MEGILSNLGDPLLAVLAALAIAVAAAFAFGSSWNLKRGNDTLRWLRAALPVLGERTTLQWMGTSVVKLTIANAKKPFKDIEILVVMEPRDIPIFWLHGHLNGRRDSLIFRGHLRQPPAFEVELLQPFLWTGREALAQIDQKAWTSVTLKDTTANTGKHPFVALANNLRGADYLQQWFPRAMQLTPDLARISLRRAGEYQMQWHATLPRLSAVSAAAIVSQVQQMAGEASA